VKKAKLQEILVSHGSSHGGDNWAPLSASCGQRSPAVVGMFQATIVGPFLVGSWRHSPSGISASFEFEVPCYSPKSSLVSPLSDCQSACAAGQGAIDAERLAALRGGGCQVSTTVEETPVTHARPAGGHRHPMSLPTWRIAGVLSFLCSAFHKKVANMVRSLNLRRG